MALLNPAFPVLQLLFLTLSVLYWTGKISATVTEPYLDEVFHVRQAQAYLQGRWDVWDPKITTPPGLYLVSWVIEKTLVPFGTATGGSTSGLRAVNAYGGALMLFLLLRQILKTSATEPQSDDRVYQGTGWSDVQLRRLGHSAINICLLPPLFFFYGLYYTDVLSALSFLVTFHFHVKNQQNKVIFAGLFSLLFRQTNVFWSGVFLGGLQLIRILPRGRPNIEFPRRATILDVLGGSWDHSCVYDPPIEGAYVEDYIKCAASLVIAILRNLSSSLWSLSSYILIIFGFVEFVFWNGGVVLGDKENHVASIHLAQMLYIWPYFIFFSLPILYPYIVNLVIPQDKLPSLLRRGSTRPYFPRLSISISALVLMTAIVHYNTIVHPFTLADNRHYMFYIFRLLRRHPAIKYLVAPIYFVSAWTCLLALSSPLSSTRLPETQKPKPKSQPGPTSKETPPSSTFNTRTSFLLIWLLTTTLSLSTAPLVEPRYLILPWLTWRMHIAVSDSTSTSKSTSHPTTTATETWDLVDTNLCLETAWFLTINALTGYMFLHRGFEWPQEPGTVQRFMW